MVAITTYQISTADDYKDWKAFDRVLESYEQFSGDSERALAESVKSLSDDSSEEEVIHLRNAKNTLKEQIKYCSEYQTNIINQINSGTRQLNYSLFSDQNSYNRLNTLKYLSDLERQKKIEFVKPGNTKAIELTLKNRNCGLLLLFITLLLSIALADRRMTTIVYSCRDGRVIFRIRKLFVLFVFELAASFIVHFVIFTVYLLYYGGVGSLNISIQSSQEFTLFPFPLRVIEFLCVYCVVTSICFAAIGGVLYFIYDKVILTSIGHFIAGSMLVLSYYLYIYIEPKSALNYLHYINLYELTFPGTTMFKYENWGNNYFVTGTLESGLVLAIFITLFFSILSILTIQHPYSGAKKSLFLAGVINQFQQIKSNILTQFNLPIFEIMKLLVQQKGIIIVLFFIYLLSGIKISRGISNVDMNMYLRQFYVEFNGSNDINGITAYQDELKNLRTERMEIEEKTTTDQLVIDELNETIATIQKHVEYLNVQNNSDVVVLNQVEYEQLFGARMNLNQEELFTLMIIAEMLICYSLFSYDNDRKMHIMQHCSKKRDAVFKYKILSIILLSVIISISMFTLHFKNIADVYQLNLKNAAIQSLFQFADFPLHISILQYWLLMAGISTFVYIILAIIFACIATNKNNRIIIAFDFILMIPFCLYLFKLKQAEYLSLPVILDTNRMLNSNQAIYTVIIILITISAIICLVRTSNKWKEQS